MKWKYIFLPFFLLFLSHQAESTHIVGGEIELVHDSAYFYDVNLILYFDSVNGNAGAQDAFVRVGVFRKIDDVLIDTFILPQTDYTNVPYSFPDCSIPELVTKRITYSTKTELSPGDYNNPDGYYIAWDRCCRNNQISNLLSPGAQGQLFYLEFPPVELSGTQFINSSPVLFPPVSDYACKDELFYFDFSGSDPDGDSLVYSLADPLRGYSSANNPVFLIPFPSPYPSVVWQAGINVNNMIPGTPPLQISPTGFLTVKPDQFGLFVFAVKCEEFRNGIKIGEIRRDFQIIVRDCPANEKPLISVQNPVDSTSYFEDDTLYFDLNNRCFDIFLKDSDPDTKFDVVINTLNFDPSFITITPKNGLLPNSGDSLKATICFNKCAASFLEPYQFEIILSDDGCSLPKKDTFLITALVEAIPDMAPLVNSNFIGDSLILEVGDTIFMNINGFDSDNDTIVLGYGNNSFNPADFGMQFGQVKGPGQVTRTFFWVPTCNALALNGDSLIFRVYDFFCSNYFNELVFPLKITTDNKPPLVSSDIVDPELNIDIRQELKFNLTVSDSNRNDILLLLPSFYDSSGLRISNLDFSLEKTSNRGSFTSEFTLIPNCDFLDFGKIRFQFIARDNGCEREFDTLSFIGNINYENSKPEISLKQIINNGKQSLALKIYTDSLATLDFEGSDDDLDFLEMEIEWQNPDDSLIIPINFQTTPGIGQSTARLQIGPGTCSAADLINSKLNIILTESSCENFKDTFELEIEIEEFFNDIKVPNVFTPNGDGYNDYFYPEQLPKRCRFSEIIIYNRWGREVYKTEVSDFRWDASDVPAGDYFYQIRFEDYSYKGIIKVMK